MPKLTLDDLVSLANQTTAVTTINANNALIETALENTLSRDGTSPNAMGANLDMNSNRILNLPAPSADTEPVRKGEFDELVADTTDILDDIAALLVEAEAARDAAQLAETNAETAETNAETAETNAETAETNAEAAQAAAEAAAAQALLNSENPAVGYNFDTNTADSDPGAGDLKFNHASPASVTTIYIDNVDRDGNTQTGWIDSWDDSTTVSNKGTLVIRQANDGSTFASYRVTGSIVDGTGYRKVTVTNLAAGAGTFDAGAVLAVMFTHTGDLGVSTGDVVGPASSTDFAVVRFDGATGKLVQNSAVLVDDSNDVTGMNSLTLPNTGLHLLDTNASHDLIIKPGSDLASDRTLTLTTGDADRTLTIGGNATVSQDYSTTGNPQFATVELGAATDTTISRSAAGVIAVEGVPLYSNIPVNSQSAAYTTVLADAQKFILHPTADNNARTFTIDSNANVPYPIGTCITFVNQINTVTISITSDTMTWAGSSSTGSRTLAANGMATALKVSTTGWVINGVGLS